MNKHIEIVEVGPRDGLQNEADVFSTENKLALIGRLVNAGVKRLEVASFVNHKLVPQMADAEAVVAGLPKRDDVTYIGLVLNMKGLERVLATGGIDEIGCVAVASDTFGQKNQGQSIAETIETSNAIIAAAKKEGLAAQVTISTAFGCPFEGNIPPEQTLDVVRRLAESNPREISIADTIGAAVPAHVEEVFGKAKDFGIPLRGHFHDTRNTGVANSWAAYQAGASVIDSSIGGLGGCPFAPRATGNVATEDVVSMFHRSSIDTGLSLEGLINVTKWLEGEMGRTLPAKLSRAGAFKE